MMPPRKPWRNSDSMPMLSAMKKWTQGSATAASAVSPHAFSIPWQLWNSPATDTASVTTTGSSSRSSRTVTSWKSRTTGSAAETPGRSAAPNFPASSISAEKWNTIRTIPTPTAASGSAPRMSLPCPTILPSPATRTIRSTPCVSGLRNPSTASIWSNSIRAITSVRTWNLP